MIKSRYPRQYSKTEIYHIMLRGNEIKEILELFSSDIEKALKEFIHYNFGVHYTTVSRVTKNREGR